MIRRYLRKRRAREGGWRSLLEPKHLRDGCTVHSLGNTVLFANADTQGSARDWHNAGDGMADFPMIGLDRPTLNRDLISLGAPYQWVFIDGATKLEKMIAAAVKAADLVLIPIQPSPLDI